MVVVAVAAVVMVVVVAVVDWWWGVVGHARHESAAPCRPGDAVLSSSLLCPAETH